MIEHEGKETRKLLNKPRIAVRIAVVTSAI
jgi:hypothetical protein